MAIKLAINGFGRIGRAVMRNALRHEDFEIVAINDLMEPQMMAYLLAHDSVHKELDREVEFRGQELWIDGKRVQISHHPEPGAMECEADVLIESTGKFLSQELASPHLGYAKRVILSAPSLDDTPTFVYGVNHTHYRGQSILSNASCTTNCLAPIAKLVDEAFGIEMGLMTTIHSYTIDQNLLDSDHRRDIRRARAAALNILPTTTGAAKAIHRVLPGLEGRLHGRSVRVPVADVSLMDLDLVVSKECSETALNELFKEAAKGEFAGILGVDEEYRVSQDFVGCELSSVVATDLTQVIGGRMVKIMSWYDNEWGYANRLLDMARFVTQYQTKE